MTDLGMQVGAAAKLFASAGLDFAIVGGLAVSARTEPRFTRDVDVAVALPDDRAAERLIRHARAEGYRAFMLIEHDVAKRIATVRLQSESGILDLLFASSGIENETVDEAERLEILPGILVPVARVPHLMALKLLARDDQTRPQDHADLVRLRSVANAADRARLAELVALIVARGYHRSRDLVALAADFLR
ncbi:nucleotidyl transferase AbiEii/AbiGii toxin family protein [soil metagenome]